MVAGPVLSEGQRPKPWPLLAEAQKSGHIKDVPGGRDRGTVLSSSAPSSSVLSVRVVACCAAQRYCKDNPSRFHNADGAYMLSFCIIMLNTGGGRGPRGQQHSCSLRLQTPGRRRLSLDQPAMPDGRRTCWHAS